MAISETMLPYSGLYGTSWPCSVTREEIARWQQLHNENDCTFPHQCEMPSILFVDVESAPGLGLWSSVFLVQHFLVGQFDSSKNPISNMQSTSVQELSMLRQERSLGMNPSPIELG
jgi:hypothetical protein